MKANFLVWTSLLFIGGYLFLTNSPLFELKSIVLKGDFYKDTNDLNKLFTFFMGENIFKIPLKDIEKMIKGDPKISEVKIEKRLPSELMVYVFRKKPVFLVNLDNIYGFTEKREIIPLFAKDESYRYPIITGLGLSSFNFYRQINTQKTNLSTDIYHAIKEVDSTFFSMISEINLRDLDNPVLYLFPYGVKVMLGTGDYPIKIKRLKSILALENLKDVKTIDLRFKDQALVKKVKEG